MINLDLEELKAEALLKNIYTGSHGSVWKMQGGRIAKIFWKLGEESLHQAKKEFEIHQKLHSLGISVPVPYERRKVDLNQISTEKTGSPRYTTAIVMEEIENPIPYLYLSEKDKNLLEKLRMEELAKAEAERFIPDDNRPGINCLYVPSKQKIYLIDFTLWKSF